MSNMVLTEIKEALEKGSVLEVFLSQGNSILTYVGDENYIRGYGSSHQGVLDSMISTEEMLTVSSRPKKGITREIIESGKSSFLEDVGIFELNKMCPNLWVKKGRRINCFYENGKFVARLIEPSQASNNLERGIIYSNMALGHSVGIGEESYPWGAISNAFENFRNNLEIYFFQNITPKEQPAPEESNLEVQQKREIWIDEGFYRNFYAFRCHSKDASSF